MPGAITVTPEQLQEISSQLRSGAGEVESLLNQLAGYVSPLQADWVGTAQAQFEALWAQWQRDAKGLNEALLGVATLTQNASNAYASTEQSVASSFTQA